MVLYKPVKITINILDLAKIILNVVVQYYSLLNSIMSNWSLVFTSKFRSSLCYFLEIKQKLSVAFHLQIDNQTEGQNSTIKVYLQTFANYEQNNWARLFLIAEFAYKNVKNIGTGHIFFEFNYDYHLYVFYKKNINLCFKLK